MTERVLVTSRQVPLNVLKPHPRNPRRGNPDAIAESLKYHGQYRPIVVQASTNHIVAGNHTYQAAKQLGWGTIAVTYLDIDDDTAERILIADNRTSDLASYNNNLLSELLHSLPDLDGTGFTQMDLDGIDGLFDADTDDQPTEPKEPSTPATIQIRHLQIWVDAQPLEVWRSQYADLDKRSATELVRSMLGFNPTSRPNPKERHAPENISGTVETVPIKTLVPFDGNAREGDIGAIAESLKHLGQYRPVVARRGTNEILVGNHTWRAAKHLGWKNIAVAWVDVDDDQAARIVLIDNKTSDQSSYDDSSLLALLTNVSNLDGTGYTPEDLDDLLNDIKTDRDHKPAPTKDIRVKVDKWVFRVPPDEYAQWSIQHPEHQHAAIVTKRLGIPDGTWTTERPQS